MKHVSWYCNHIQKYIYISTDTIKIYTNHNVNKINNIQKFMVEVQSLLSPLYFINFCNIKYNVRYTLVTKRNYLKYHA